MLMLSDWSQSNAGFDMRVCLARQDGTVGLNREKMRLREERLVQLRNRKKGGKRRKCNYNAWFIWTV
jgi:hypothetical protein